jgi:hypothetical protein
MYVPSVGGYPRPRVAVTDVRRADVEPFQAVFGGAIYTIANKAQGAHC